MRNIRVAAASLNQTPLDFKNNTENIVSILKEAKEKQVSILCLPELAITGYGCEDAFFFQGIRKQAIETLNELITYTDNIITCFGLPYVVNNTLYNCVAIVGHKKILGIIPKQNLASDGVHYEPRWFKPWPQNESIILDDKILFGDLILHIDGIRIGLEICEDAWVADRPGARLSKQCADVILNPSASHFAFDRYKIRQQFVTEGSRAFRCTYVYSNLLGNEAGRIIYSGDTIIAHNGKIVAEGPRLSFPDKYILTSAVVDIEQNQTKQIENGSFKANNNEIPFFLTPTINEAEKIEEYDNNITISTLCDRNKYDEFTQAVTLGLYDYMRKSKTKGFVISLSGGVDSSVCALLVHYMYKHIEFWVDNNCPQKLICLYQRSKNSSTDTELAAEKLATAINSQYGAIDISTINNEYIVAAEKFLGKQLNWEEDDIALQNIQARVRAPSAWLIANTYNYLLLTTSNRSEAAVGYATLDGDTAGGLAPIAGVSKEFLLDWLQYQLHQPQVPENIKEAIKIIRSLKPTAELRPRDQNQIDEEDLMPYPILDLIEKEAIHNKHSPEEVFAILRYYQDPGSYLDDFIKSVDDIKLKFWINRFFKLWCQNQFKRERYAVSFHLDDANLDPKTWCRFPVLSGGFNKLE